MRIFLLIDPGDAEIPPPMTGHDLLVALGESNHQRQSSPSTSAFVIVLGYKLRLIAPRKISI